jgi:hypothetical protein
VALVDHEGAWQGLKGFLASVPQGIGVDRLLAVMGRLEVEHTLDESVLERALRVYGVELAEDIRTRGIQPALPEALAPLADGPGAAPTEQPKEASWSPPQQTVPSAAPSEHRPPQPSPRPSPIPASTGRRARREREPSATRATALT